MVRSRWLVGAAAFGVLVVLYGGLTGGLFEDAAPAGNPPDRQGPRELPSGAESGAEGTAGLRRAEDHAPGTLVVRASIGGSPARGTAALVTGPDFAPLYHSLASTFAPGAQDARGVLHLDFQSSFEVPVPPRHWSWLRIWEAGGNVRFLRVPPFRDRAERDVHLDPEHHTIRVQVYRADHRTPAGGARVRLLASAIGDTAYGEEKVHVADADGHLDLQGLAPGVYLVACEHARPGDRQPHTSRVVLPPPGGREVLCTLVEPESRHETLVEVLGEGLAGSSVAPKLFLRRMDDGSMQVYSQMGTLRDGHQVLRFSVPAGLYQPDVLPQLAVAVDGHDGRLEINESGESRFRLMARGQEETVELRLSGPQLQHFPLRVFVQPVDAVRNDDPTLFLGGFHWHEAVQDVAPAKEPLRVIATGRLGSFLSREPVLLRGEVAVAEMIRATELVIVWFGWPPLPDPEVLISVRVEGEAALCRLRPELVPWFGGGRPALTASVVVPYGPIDVECVHATAGVLWKRNTHATRARTVLRIDEPARPGAPSGSQGR